MNNFYVYSTKEHGITQHIFVDEEVLWDFAEDHFDPYTTDFSGVMVEADSETEAYSTYKNLTGKIFSVEEPTATSLRRASANIESAIDNIAKSNAKIMTHVLARKLSEKVIECNEIMCQIAKLFRIAHDEEPDKTAEMIYEEIKRRYIKQIKEDLNYDL